MTDPAVAASAAVLVMGVSGSGKTNVGRAVAEQLGWTFIDADDFHPPSNLAKMRHGVALTDADREPWLETLNLVLRRKQHDGVNVVLACSALKRSYRQTLASGVTGLQIIHLDVPQDVVFKRVRTRRDHFMPTELVDSQFADLEVPTDREAIIVNADRPKNEVVDHVLAELRLWLADQA
ncbi:MAG TPA: gluconokinase [Microthrixaceae bacterium]|nr:gluconokinase [Microthrixaceae bacterium]